MCGCRGSKAAGSTSRAGAKVEVVAGADRGKRGTVVSTPRPGIHKVQIAPGQERDFYASFLRFL